jgi:hypothetical protein
MAQYKTVVSGFDNQGLAVAIKRVDRRQSKRIFMLYSGGERIFFA